MDDAIRRAEAAVRQREAASRRAEELAKQYVTREQLGLDPMPEPPHYEAEQVGQLDHVIELLLDERADRRRSRNWQVATFVTVVVGLLVAGATLLVTVLS